MIDLDELERLHTAGEWRWQGEDYRGGWGWQLLVGPKGEGLIIGQDLGTKRAPSKWLRAYVPVDPRLCVTGMSAAQVDARAEAVHVLEPVAKEIIALHNAFPALLAELRAARALIAASFQVRGPDMDHGDYWLWYTNGGINLGHYAAPSIIDKQFRAAVAAYRAALAAYDAATNPGALTAVLEGLAQAGRGEVHDLGSFAQFKDDELDGGET